MGDRLGAVYTRTCVQRWRVRETRKSDGSSDRPRVGRKRASMDVSTVSIRRDPRKSTICEYFHIRIVVADHTSKLIRKCVFGRTMLKHIGCFQSRFKLYQNDHSRFYSGFFLFLFKHQNLPMFVVKWNKWVFFTHLKLWVAVARRNFKLVKLWLR